MKIEKKIFDQEIAMCRKLYKKSKGCNWGKCKDCGVIPLLYKICKNKLVDNKKEAVKLKRKILSV